MSAGDREGAPGRYAGIVAGIRDVVSRWGGDFFVEDGVPWKKCIREWKASGGVVVHLTMYGEPVQERVADIRENDRILVVVGAEKVPGEIYLLADYNIAVTNQPHSEVAGLAVFLDRLFEGRELAWEFPGARIRVVPSPRGKRCEEI